MALDWIQNLFQSEQTRGLSGDSATAVALDESNPYYNYRLRRHKAEGDLVGNPALLWHTSASVKRRGGLGIHIASEKGEGVATFTDVLLILSHEDYSRAVSQTSEPWLQRAVRSLLSEFDDFSRKESFARRYPHRQLGFRILCDGSADMGGQQLGLGAGDFITGLLPNLYTGPVRGSFPVIGVHLNLPGVWDGYKEIGRLYNDQILFTLGSHWLDNFHHPALREAALYRLQQYPDGSFVHIINPDLQDRYQVTSTDQGGASVLTLATRDGQPVAYMVLAVIDPPAEQQVTESKKKPNINIPEISSPMATIPPPMLIDDELTPIPAKDSRRPQQGQQQAQAAGPLGLGSKTIIPDAPSQRIFTLQERGALLQKVHFANFMEGYDVYLGTRGELGTVVEDKAATFQVRRKRVSLLAHVDGIQVAGYPVAPGVEIPIEGDVTIHVAGQRLEYRDLRHITSDGWPYVGEIRRPASSNYMVWGDQYRVGRSRDCRVILPDEPRNDNIQWKPSVGDGATIRARTGDIPKSRFYTDSIMVASEHAHVDLRGDDPMVACQARHCYVYVRRGSEILVLYPTESGKQPTEANLVPGDEVLIGNCLFQVGFTPREEGVAPAPAPKIELSADQLVNAVGPSILDDIEANKETPEPPVRKKAPERPKEDEPPAAYGIGQPGVAPKPVPLPPAGVDSILGAAPEFEDEQMPPPTNPRRSATPSADEEPPPVVSTMSSMDIPPAPPTPPGPPMPPPSPKDRTVQLYDDEDFDDPPPAPKTAEPSKQSLQIESWDADGEGSLDEPTENAPKRAPDTMDEPAPAPTTLDEPPPPPDPGPPPRRPVMPSLSDAPPPPPGRRSLGDAPPPPPADGPPPVAAAPPPLPAIEEPPAPPPAPVVAAPPPAPMVPPPAPAAPPPAPVVPPPVAAEPPPAPVVPPPVAAEPPPAPAPPAAAAAPVAAAAAPTVGSVVAVDDAEAQFELGRRMQLVHVGWTVNGTAVCGNHTKADLIVPENRVVEGQEFVARDYFQLKVRGRRGTLELRAPRELLINGDDPSQEAYEDPEKLTVDVIRRDDRGDEDFAVRLVLVEDKSLPDPRARFLEIDCGDPLAAALFTRGLPNRQPRAFEIEGIKFQLLFDGENVQLSDYLDGYRDGKGGFKPFFVQRNGERFQTAPEDGAAVMLAPGDKLVVGHCVYALRKG